MLNSSRNILVMIVIASFFSFAWGAENKPGGQGFITNEYGTLNSREDIKCFDVEKGSIASVCARYRINWKLWSLMGEPVGNYNLTWTLTSITLRNSVGGRQQYNSIDSLPNELQKAARAIELHIYGVAVISARFSALYHGFDTGLGVRADMGNSMNVPGSPSWDTLFLIKKTCDDKEFSKKNSNVNIYMDANTAKLEFKKGIELHSLTICSQSSVSELSSLESSIKELCKGPGADKTYRFCPEQKIKKEKIAETNAIENAFSKLEEKAAETPAVKAGSIDDAFATLRNKVDKSSTLKAGSIDDAFATLGNKVDKSSTLKAGSIDDAFRQMEADRIEEERLQAVAIADRIEKERLQEKEKRSDIYLTSTTDPVKEPFNPYVDTWKPPPTYKSPPTYRSPPTVPACKPGSGCVMAR